MGRHADHAAVYEAIDKIKSIAQMREKLENLDYDLREA
jgi:hypothetical protein